MEVQVGVEVPLIESFDLRRVRRSDMAVPHVLSHHPRHSWFPPAHCRCCAAAAIWFARSKAAEEAFDRANQIAAAAQQRQWAGGNQEWRGGEKAHGVQPYHCAARGGDRSFLSAALQPLLELPSAMRCTGGGDQCQGQGETSVPMVRDAVGDPTAVAGPGEVPQGRRNDPGSGAAGGRADRHCGCGGNATSQGQIVRQHSREEDRVREKTWRGPPLAWIDAKEGKAILRV